MAEKENVEYRDILRETDRPFQAAELTDLHRGEGWMLMGVATIHGGPNQSGDVVYNQAHRAKLLYYFARKVP